MASGTTGDKNLKVQEDKNDSVKKKIDENYAGLTLNCMGLTLDELEKGIDTDTAGTGATDGATDTTKKELKNKQGIIFKVISSGQRRIEEMDIEQGATREAKDAEGKEAAEAKKEADKEARE